MTPEGVWAGIAKTELASRPDITAGTGFGKSRGLRVSGKIFAMFIHDELVVKLPRVRVDELVATRGARNFDPGHGRLMKEWAVMPETAAGEWPTLVGEARSYVDPGGHHA
ncbi:MAG TPA: hypothetical protein VFH02_03880 [Jiangellaceae bacterium]|nr:hypothetical protein [Jiangellaceae bacterium]